MSKKIFLCAISNITSGTCLEDCQFCTQSVKFHADIERYTKKPIDEIIKQAHTANALGALGFCLVTAGKGIDDKTLNFVSSIAKVLKKELPNLNLIACNGTASVDQLIELKKAGIDSYNHNLESAKSYYPNICTTHNWEERYETCLNVKKADLKLCTGGIFGLGESKEQQLELVKQIVSLDPESVPLNFYHHNTALPLKKNNLNLKENLELIALMRKHLGHKKRIMVAGGREITFKDNQADIFKMGANAIVIGDYLTTSGQQAKKDLEMLRNNNLEIATSCND